MQKTRNYDMFKFREDNRDGGVRKSHVEALKKSILTCNLLEIKPIDVNQDMEIIDGQHRLMAAKELGLEIYYNVKKDLKAQDIILLNVSRPWSHNDYLNYYAKNGYEHYVELEKILKENNLQLRLALQLHEGCYGIVSEKFKKGEFVLNKEIMNSKFFVCKIIVDCMQKNLGRLNYFYSSRLWRALIKIIRHPNFDLEKMVQNINQMAYRISPKATINHYVTMFTEIHNRCNKKKVRFENTEFGENDSE